MAIVTQPGARPSNDGHIVEPPIVDFLYCDTKRAAYVVTFVPEDTVSLAETEVVEIPESSSDGQRIALQLETLSHLWKASNKIARAVHGGGGDFTFHFAGGLIRSLGNNSADPDVTHDVYRSLQDIAMTAQVVFILRQRQGLVPV